MSERAAWQELLLLGYSTSTCLGARPSQHPAKPSPLSCSPPASSSFSPHLSTAALLARAPFKRSLAFLLLSMLGMRHLLQVMAQLRLVFQMLALELRQVPLLC